MVSVKGPAPGGMAAGLGGCSAGGCVTAVGVPVGGAPRRRRDIRPHGDPGAGRAEETRSGPVIGAGRCRRARPAFCVFTLVCGRVFSRCRVGVTATLAAYPLRDLRRMGYARRTLARFRSFPEGGAMSVKSILTTAAVALAVVVGYSYYQNKKG